MIVIKGTVDATCTLHTLTCTLMHQYERLSSIEDLKRSRRAIKRESTRQGVKFVGINQATLIKGRNESREDKIGRRIFPNDNYFAAPGSGKLIAMGDNEMSVEVFSRAWSFQGRPSPQS